jgi:hypothetical protein
MEHHLHPLAIHHLPFFVTPPGSSDILLSVVVVLLIGAVVTVGVLYLKLHSFPERMAHHHSKVQMEIVAVLCLIALFTHQHIFWIIGLLLAMVQIPDWSSQILSIAQSLEKIAGRRRPRKTVESPAKPLPPVYETSPRQPVPTMNRVD